MAPLRRNLNELAVIIGMTSFWSNVLHVQNYDYNKFVQELVTQMTLISNTFVLIPWA